MGDKALSEICQKDVLPAALVLLDRVGNILAKQALDAGVQAFKLHKAGDEFAMVIQGMEPKMVLQYCELVRSKIEHGSKATASFGIANRSKGEPMSMMEQRAEKAQNQAKKQG